MGVDQPRPGAPADRERTGYPVVPAPRRPESTRDRVIDAAVELTGQDGWGSVTMAKLAQHAGVSRQTVYNDVGGKSALAAAMISRELERFLDHVSRAFEAHADDLEEAVRAATYNVLVSAQDNRLLHAIVSATHGADTELLPFLTTHSQGLLGSTRELVRERVDSFDHGLDPAELEIVIDTIVRVVLSHVMQPLETPEESAERVAWLLGRVLRTPTNP